MRNVNRADKVQLIQVGVCVCVVQKHERVIKRIWSSDIILTIFIYIKSHFNIVSYQTYF